MKIVVAGTGYVGLVTGICFAEKGQDVICVDTDELKIQKLKQGISPIYEPGIEDLMKKNYNAGRLNYTTNYEMAYEQADIIFIAVGTPEKIDGSANLTYVYDVARQIAKTIKKDCIIVIKSTVPIGTNDDIEKFIIENLENKVNIEVVSNPEFLSQGTAIKDTLEASRIIIGIKNENVKNIMRQLYENFNIPIVFMGRRSSEMVKYASNNFLALKISYINDIANLCEVVGANIEDVTKGMSYDDRIGSKFLNAGCGYGGSCFPKDTKALHFLATQDGYDLKSIEAAILINKRQKIILIEKAKKRISNFKGLNVAILGLSFKPNTDDLREAPSLDNIEILLEEGANIKVYDPKAMDNLKKIYPNQITYANSVEETLKNADICFIFTEWEEIKLINPQVYKKLMKTPLIYDGRNIYNLKDMKENKIEYYSIGRPQ